MGERLKVGRILPTRKNAEAMVTMTREDLLRADVPMEIVESLAGGTHDQINTQRGRLYRHPERYLGAVAGRQLPFGLGSSLEGFAKIGQWNRADQAQYDALGVHEQNAENRRHENSLGIFALVVAADVLTGGRQDEVAGQLLNAVVARAGGQTIEVGLHHSDPLLPVFEEQGFQATEAVGVPIPSVPAYRTRLFIR